LYITGHYYQNVTGNMPKVVEALQESIQTYPSQVDSYINITAAYTALGEFQKALPFARKAVEMQPEDSIAAENMLGILLGLNQIPEAKAEMERAQKLGLDTSTLDLTGHLQTYFLLGEPDQVQKIMTKVAGQPDEFLATQVLASTQLFAGQYSKAAGTIQQAYEQAGRAKAPDVQANVLLTNAASRGLAGLCDGSEAAVQQALGLDRSRQTESFAVLASGICGNSKLVQSLAEELAKKYPDDTLIQNVYVPLGKAFVALGAGQAKEALEDAEPARAYYRIFPAAYLQGLAYLQLHDASRAGSAFQNATLSPGGNLQATTIFYAQAQLGLARAYAMSGDKADAKKAYDAFFATWKTADADLPMLQAAKKEYAAL
jgi:eukaryotic-like serine/threonine-protein kinase